MCPFPKALTPLLAPRSRSHSHSSHPAPRSRSRSLSPCSQFCLLLLPTAPLPSSSLASHTAAAPILLPLNLAPRSPLSLPHSRSPLSLPTPAPALAPAPRSPLPAPHSRSPLSHPAPALAPRSPLPLSLPTLAPHSRSSLSLPALAPQNTYRYAIYCTLIQQTLKNTEKIRNLKF